MSAVIIVYRYFTCYQGFIMKNLKSVLIYSNIHCSASRTLIEIIQFPGSQKTKQLQRIIFRKIIYSLPNLSTFIDIDIHINVYITVMEF